MLDPDASRTATDLLALKDVRRDPDADFSALEELVKSDLIRLRGSIKLAMTVERAASVEVGQDGNHARKHPSRLPKPAYAREKRATPCNFASWRRLASPISRRCRRSS